MTARDRRRAVVIAGHQGDVELVTRHLSDDDPTVRASALNALERIGALTETQIVAATTDPEPIVRRHAAELAGKRPGLALDRLLADDDPTVVEVAAWACGEQEHIDDSTLHALIELTTEAADPLVREAGAAALGAIGDQRGLAAVLAACTDKPHVRRRAVLALAPFAGPEVETAISHALEDRDWQVRQAAEDLRRVSDAGPSSP
ncbi:MAG: HEAT repeat domain-containing protein [Ilumatobacteraceae bacterium]